MHIFNNAALYGFRRSPTSPGCLFIKYCMFTQCWCLHAEITCTPAVLLWNCCKITLWLLGCCSVVLCWCSRLHRLDSGRRGSPVSGTVILGATGWKVWEPLLYDNVIRFLKWKSSSMYKNHLILSLWNKKWGWLRFHVFWWLAIGSVNHRVILVGGTETCKCNSLLLFFNVLKWHFFNQLFSPSSLFLLPVLTLLPSLHFTFSAHSYTFPSLDLLTDNFSHTLSPFLQSPSLFFLFYLSVFLLSWNRAMS